MTVPTDAELIRRSDGRFDPERQITNFKRLLKASHSREMLLREALDRWGYHLDDCPAFYEDDPGECDCGWVHLGWLCPSRSGRSAKYRTMLEALIGLSNRNRWLEGSHKGRNAQTLARLHAQHDVLVGWLAEAGRPLTEEMRHDLWRAGVWAEAEAAVRARTAP